MAKENKGQQQRHYTEEERLKLGLMVCELYESQGATIESCCKCVGISDRLFRLWCVQVSELSEAYKKAKGVQERIYWDRLKPLAESAMERLLKGETKTETKRETGENDKGSYEKESITQSEILPNATVTIFAMKGLYPDRFIDRTQAEVNHSGNVGVTFVFETGGAPVFNSEKDVIEDDDTDS